MLTGEQKKLIVGGMVVLVVGGIVSAMRLNGRLAAVTLNKSPSQLQIETVSTPAYTMIEPETVRIHLAGAVRNPGVYDMDERLRVLEAIEIQGGFLPEADLDRVNLAAKLKDGKRIWVPYRKGSKPKTTKGQQRAQKKSQSQMVSLNSASVEELILLPGIGPALANRIVLDRATHGPYNDLDDLIRVKGIGPKLVNRLRSHLRL